MDDNEIYYNPSWVAIDNWINSEFKKASDSNYPYGYGNLSRHLKTPGVYAIYFPDTKKILFGSSSNLYKIRRRHLKYLLSNSHTNKALQDTFNASENKAFMFFYIETTNHPQAVELQQKIIDDYDDNPNLINENNRIVKGDTYIDTDNAYKIIEYVTECKYRKKEMTQENPSKPDVVKSKGIVFYSDGSAAPKNPGFIGWGVHGYLYENEVPKKGAGNPTHILTTSGYVPKLEKATTAFMEVKPLLYFDFFGSSLERGSNNIAELEAARNALVQANAHDVKYVAIYTDSEYVRKGVEEWSPTWVKNNWFKRDGTPVPNSEFWKPLLAEINKLKEKGVDVTFTWVKGHNKILGNEIADKLASIGSFYSGQGQLRNEFNVSQVEGYWKIEIEKHPFISNKRMYFNTTEQSQIVGEYYLGDHGSDDELMGTKSSDTSYSVIQLKTPDPMLERIRKFQTNLACDIDTLINVRVDKLFSPDVFSEIEKYEDAAFVRDNSYSLDLSCLDGMPLSKEQRPARLSMRTILAINYLRDKLELFKAVEKDSTILDTRLDNFKFDNITTVFYDKDTKVKKGVQESSFKLKERYVVGFDNLKLPTLVTKGDKPHEISVSLTLGIDLPDRNGLKHLEELKPELYLVTWNESPQSIRYAVVGKSDGSYGIWAGMHSNVMFI